MTRTTITVVRIVAFALAAIAAAPDEADARRSPLQRRRATSRPTMKTSQAAAATATPIDLAGARQLGQALAAYRAADFAAASKHVKPLVEKKLRNQDYAWYLAGQAAALDGHCQTALPFFRRLAVATGSRFQTIARWRIADCLWELGRTESARREYQRLVAKGTGGDAGVALFRIGESYVRARAHSAGTATATATATTATAATATATVDGAVPAEAVAAWRRLVLELPDHPLATLASDRLTSGGRGGFSAQDRIARARVLKERRSWDRALEELDKIGDDVPAAVKRQRDFWTGETLFSMRRQYRRAGELLIAIHAELDELAPQALFHGARALSRADLDEDAIRWYQEVVRKYPGSKFAAEAQFLSGWLRFNDGDCRAALPALEQHLARFGNSRFADDSRWYLGFSLYLLGEHEKALHYLDRLAQHKKDLVGGKGRYWRSMALLRLGKVSDATIELRRLVGDYPFNWYSMLARTRLRELGISIGPFGDNPGKPEDAPRLEAATPAVTNDAVVKRVDELLAAGMEVEAADELLRGERSLRNRHGTAAVLPVLFDRYRRAENYHRPWMLALTSGGRALDLPPKGAARAWWEHAYPLAYRVLVESYQDLGDNPPYYLYAIMYKESGFNPHDVSYADAIGLLQMIPPTTRRVAAALGVEYTGDFLYDPGQNIKVASWYIGRLFRKFRRQVPIGAGSFNSGPRAVMGWLDEHGSRPLDEFVERVPYTQTREYMKKVTAIYARYVYLYGGTDYQQTMAVDPAYEKDDLTY
ncbi:MAG: transglycosylase SLT domain-containing protein [Pseudomonadota bacterium]